MSAASSLLTNKSTTWETASRKFSIDSYWSCPHSCLNHDGSCNGLEDASPSRSTPKPTVAVANRGSLRTIDDPSL
eukprot:CCRYP_008620-RC/>CCRYP_008620-RC protein AED:0.48 eAED:1.00 QI:0/0/0/1/0/0/3/0/74